MILLLLTARLISSSFALSLRFLGDFCLESKENGRCTSLATELRLGEDPLATFGLELVSCDSLDLILVDEGLLIRVGAVGVDILRNDSRCCLRCGEGSGTPRETCGGSEVGNATGLSLVRARGTNVSFATSTTVQIRTHGGR